MDEHRYVELASELWQAFNRHDLDAVTEMAHPDFEGHSANTMAEGGEPYRGSGGARAWWADLFDTWSDVQTEFEQALVLGDHIFQVLTITYTTREGMNLATPVYMIGEFRGDLIVYVRTFFDAAEALAELSQRLSRSHAA